MSDGRNLDIDELEKLAKLATPGDWWIDSHGCHMIAHTSTGMESVFNTSQEGDAVRHADTGNLSRWRNDNDATYIANASPKIVLELIARLKEAEALNRELAQASVSSIPENAKLIVLQVSENSQVTTDQIRYIAESFARFKSTANTEVLCFIGNDVMDVSSFDEAKMLENGWIPAPKLDPVYECEECSDRLCGGTGVYEGLKCDGIPF